jgi:hypothetical protein
MNVNPWLRQVEAVRRQQQNEERSRENTIIPEKRVRDQNEFRTAVTGVAGGFKTTQGTVDKGKIQKFIKLTGREPKNMEEVNSYIRELGGGSMPGSGSTKRRMKYINSVMEAIKGRTAESLPVMFNSYGSNTGMFGGLAEKPDLMTLARQKAEDKLHSQLFRFPSTDPLAYSRRIEHDNVFQHSPMYGF